MQKKRPPGKLDSPESPRLAAEGKSPKHSGSRGRRKREAIDLESPPKLKRVRVQSKCDTVVLSKANDLNSSPSSSEGELPPAMQKIEEERRRKKELQKEKKKGKGPGKKRQSVLITVEHDNSEMDFTDIATSSKAKQMGKVRKSGGNGKTTGTISTERKQFIGAGIIFKPLNTKVSARRSIATTSELGKNSKTQKSAKNRKSVDNGKTQTFLTKWFTSPTELKTESKIHDKATVKLSPNQKKLKGPTLIEWKGKQLLIHSPKVKLKRSKGLGALNLAIDMNDRKGTVDSNKEIDMLSKIESEMRITRNMVDMDLNEKLTEIEKTQEASTSGVAKKLIKNLEIDMNISDWSSEVEMLASIDTSRRITRKSRIHSPLPLFTPSASDEYCDDSPKPLFAKKLKAKLKPKVAKKELQYNENKFDSGKSGMLVLKRMLKSSYLQRYVCVESPTNVLVNVEVETPPATTEESQSEFSEIRNKIQGEKSKVLEESVKKSQGKSPQKYKDTTDSLPLASDNETTPTTKKVNAFPFQPSPRTDPRKVNLNETYILPDGFSLLKDSPAKDVMLRKSSIYATPPRVSSPRLKQKQIDHSSPMSEPAELLPGKHASNKPASNIKDLLDLPDSPAKNLRNRQTTVSSATKPKLQQNLTVSSKELNLSCPDPSNSENVLCGTLPDLRVVWNFEGARQIQISERDDRAETENVCPVTKSSPRLKTSSSHKIRDPALKPIEQNIMSNHVDKLGGVFSTDFSEKMDCLEEISLASSHGRSPNQAYSTRLRQLPDTPQQVAGKESNGESLSEKKRVQALNDMRDKYMECLSPRHYDLDIDLPSSQAQQTRSEADTLSDRNVMSQYYAL